MIRVYPVGVPGPGDRRDRLNRHLAVALVDHINQLLAVEAVNQRLAYLHVLQRRAADVKFHLAVVAGAVKVDVGKAEHFQLFDIVRTRGKGVVVGFAGLE